MANWMAVLTAVLFIGVAGAANAQDGLRLVSRGKTDYVIVLGRDASPAEKWAAEELANHLQEICGAQLPIAQAPQRPPAKGIYVGFSDATAKLGVPEDETLSLDGYVIKTVGSNVIIAGDRPRGTLYGVYTFLESLGVRWWAQGETFIPKSPTIEIDVMDVREVPRLEYRDMMFGDLWSDEGRLWMARNKLNGMSWSDPPEHLGGRYKFVGNLVHSYMILLGNSGHEITPEMKALVNDRRTSAQPCLSNPDTVKAMTAGVLKAFDENPDARFVVVGQMDNRSYCRCPECAAIDEQEGSHAGQVIRFANMVADAVAMERPGSEIATAAYSWSRKPPKNLKPNDNVRIVLCSIECDFAHPLADASNPENKAFKEDIEGWSKIANKLMIWNYIGSRDHYLLPNPELDTLVPNTKFFVDNKVVGVFEQGTHVGVATDFAPLKKWVLAKALWNPEADGKALISEFVNGYYGPAGPAIQDYIDIMHRTGRQQDFHLGRRVRLNAPYLKPEIIVEAEGALRKAEQLAEGDATFARRVRHAHMGVQYVLAKRGPGSATWQAFEDRFGPIDFRALSDRLALVVEENEINKVNDPAPIEPFLAWLDHYAALVAERGRVVPPELEDASPDSYRLIQACQMDMMPGWWKPTEGASDGWAVHVPGRGWHTKMFFSKWDDLTPGKPYKLFARARGRMNTDATGTAWEFGVYPKGKTRRVAAEDLRDGRWHVFELPEWTSAEGQYFWTALTDNKDVEAVEVDCIWLVPTP